MQIFIDTANINEIKKYAKIGIIDGVTTNPALVAKEGKDFRKVVTEICSIVDGPVSAEVVSKDVDGMIKEELIDKFVFYMAPKILGVGKLNFSKLEGSLKNLGTIALEVEEVEVIGDDLKVSIAPKYNRNEIK